jgi:heme/copper-type cytochrome/quinol oxidase subunit 3
VAVATVVLDLRQSPFDHAINAYGSAYWLLSALMAVLVVGGLGQNLFTQAGAWMGNYSVREHVAVEVGTLYWIGVLAMWLVMAATIYVSPYLLG